jgi:heme exporter protein D
MSGAGAWAFVWAAYGVAVGGTALLALWAVMALRRAEARLDAFTRP